MEPETKIVSGFEVLAPRGEVKHRRGDFVLADRTLGGPRTSPETDDLKNTIEEAEDRTRRAEMREANRLMRAKRKREKKRAEYNRARDEELLPHIPADMVCLLCKRHKPRRQQWLLIALREFPDMPFACCSGCARRLQTVGAVK